MLRTCVQGLALTTAFAAVVLQSAHAAEPGNIGKGMIQQAAAISGPRLLSPGEQPESDPESNIAEPRLLRMNSAQKTSLRPVPVGSKVGTAVPARSASVIEVTPNHIQVLHQPPNASLYPSPRPNIPWQMGGTYITNQAFAPHEMLYEHDYKALYPPYYYKVKGGWAVLPGGVWNHEHWKLMGTEVTVKYRSKKPLFYGGLWKLP